MTNAFQRWLDDPHGAVPSAAHIGAASGWFEIGTLTARRSLAVTDLWSLNLDIVIDVPGRYVVEAQGIDVDGRRRVARVRAVLEGKGG